MTLLDPPSTISRLILTGALWLSMFSVGLVYSVTGPILLILTEIVKSEVSKVAWALATRGLGTALGCLVRGYLIDVSRCRAISSIVAFALLAGLTAAVPWSAYLWLMFVVFFLQGVVIGFVETDACHFCIQIWGEKHAPYLMAVYSGISAGSIAAPIIAMPFIQETQHVEGVRNGSTIAEKNLFPQNSTVFLYHSETETQYLGPMSVLHFIIMGICLFVGLFLAIASHLLTNSTTTTEYEKDEEMEPVKTRKIASKKTRYILLALLTVFIFNVMGSELTYLTLLTTFVVKQLEQTETFGTQMTLFFSVFAFVGTLTFVPVSRCISASVTILAMCIVMIISSLVLAIFGSYSLIVVWCSNVGIALGGMVSYAAVFSWAGKFTDLSVRVSAILVSASTFGEMAYPAAMGPFLDTFPMVVVYVVAASAVMNAVIYVCVECVGRNAGHVELEENQSLDTTKNKMKNYSLLSPERNVNAE